MANVIKKHSSVNVMEMILTKRHVEVNVSLSKLAIIVDYATRTSIHSP